jgi:hypothetical protein
MDNRINEIRRRMRSLRIEMTRVEDVMHDQIRRDLDSTDAALQLLEMRKQLASLVADWRAAGGTEPLPTIQERLKINHRPAKEPKAASRR